MRRLLSYCFGLSAALFLAVITWSCGKTATITYRMKNIATDSVLIVRKYAGGPYVPDTSWVGYNQEVKVGMAEKGKSHVSNYRHDGGIITYFDTLDVYRLTTGRKASTDFRDASRWTYREYSSHTAEYTIVITDADF